MNTSHDNQKIDTYVGLINNQKALVVASRSLIRKKRSPFARLVAKGNIKAIIMAARNIVYSSMSKNQRDDFCRKLCDIKQKYKSLTVSELRRELVALAASTLAGIFNAVSGFVIALIWVLRGTLTNVICGCGLTGKCKINQCA